MSKHSVKSVDMVQINKHANDCVFSLVYLLNGPVIVTCGEA